MRWPLIAAAWMGFGGIVLGALGTHLLKPRLSPDDYERFATALTYQQGHAIALAALSFYALHAAPSARRALQATAALWIGGAVLFCGSLYLRALAGWQPSLAPLGGGFLMAGWLSLMFVR